MATPRYDQVWLNILARYFPPQNDFQLEREPYVGNTANTKKRANVAISNLRADTNGVIDMRKVLVVEAKRFPKTRRTDWPGRYNWHKVRVQLKDYIVSMPTEWGNVQTMYGFAAVGDKVRFYQMNMNNNPNNILTAFITGDPILDIKTDAQRIHDELGDIAALVNRRGNMQ